MPYDAAQHGHAEIGGSRKVCMQRSLSTLASTPHRPAAADHSAHWQHGQHAAPCKNSRHHGARSVTAAARGKRASGSTMSEQLAELLPEHAEAAGAADERRSGGGGGRGGGRKPRQERGRRQREDGEEDGVVEEDVEIYNIERGWIEDAVSTPGSPADARSSRRGRGTDAAGAAASDSDGVVLDEWVLDGELDNATAYGWSLPHTTRPSI